MDADLRRRLQRLGVVQGVRHLPPATPAPAFPGGRANSIPDVGGVTGRRDDAPVPLPGAELATPYGPVWVDESRYLATHRHGAYPLGDLGALPAPALALLGGSELGPRPAFLDTETTGLAGGTGTLVFLTGIALWEGESLCLRLVFLRDPAGEPAALRYLADLLAGATGLVTFNGRGFDVPLLQSRFILNRLPPTFAALPHLDLLAVARLLWRDHLPSRRLGALETALLGVLREEDDIPSWLIPDVYREYLQTGRTNELARVFYHNRVDVLSLVTLLIHCGRLAAEPAAPTTAATEWVGVGRLYALAGREAEAQAAWRRALEADLPPETAERLWRELAQAHKRRGEWEAALALWAAWAERIPWAVEPLVERAKHAEWVADDPAAALVATEEALARLERLPPALRRGPLWAELDHRRARLLAKLVR